MLIPIVGGAGYILAIMLSYGYLSRLYIAEYDADGRTFFGAIFWPLTLFWELVGTSISNFGYNLADHQITRKTKRLEEQSRHLKELQAAEAEVQKLLTP